MFTSVETRELCLQITDKTPQSVRDAFELVCLYADSQRLQSENEALKSTLTIIRSLSQIVSEN
jgi:hypothetical protein